jgi:feruloyl-CoA synthase
MGARPVTLFPDCIFGLSADCNVWISNISRSDDFSDRVTERLEHWAATAPNRVFLARRTELGWLEVTYADALSAARRIGQALLDRGLCRNRPVLILSGNGIEHALLSLACLHVGVPFVALATAYPIIRGCATLSQWWSLPWFLRMMDRDTRRLFAIASLPIRKSYL